MPWSRSSGRPDEGQGMQSHRHMDETEGQDRWAWCEASAHIPSPSPRLMARVKQQQTVCSLEGEQKMRLRTAE